MVEIMKNQLDVGLVSARQELVDFWQDDAGLVLDHSISVMKGQVQWRFVERGSVVKVNICEELSGAQRSGIELVSMARDDLEAPKEMADPDGNLLEISKRASLTGALPKPQVHSATFASGRSTRKQFR